LSVHVIGLMALLMQGCRKPEQTEIAPPIETNQPVPPEAMAPDTNPPPMAVQPPAPVPVEPAPPANVPAPAQEYVVAKGDTLSTIAKKFSVTVKAIEEANPGVVPTKLQIGQKLVIPQSSGAPAGSPSAAAPGDAMMAGGEQVYAVKSGDNLTKIAAKFSVTVKALRAENNLDTDRIKVGQKLKIPRSGPAPAPAPSAAVPSVPQTVEPAPPAVQ
jgi:LysM repeat protein